MGVGHTLNAAVLPALAPSASSASYTPHHHLCLMPVAPSAGSVAYLLGRGGATKMRLSNFSGCLIDVDTVEDSIEIAGTARQRELARLCIDITLQVLASSNPNSERNCESAPGPYPHLHHSPSPLDLGPTPT